MSTKKYKLAVFVGRFQPPHNGHFHIIEHGLDIAERVMILVGSSDKPSDPSNPFSFDVRRSMLISGLESNNIQYPEQVDIVPIHDMLYNDPKWVMLVQSIVHTEYEDTENICIIGHDKDSTSYYLNMFPQWDTVNLENHNEINSTDIRDVFFDPHATHTDTLAMIDKLNPSVYNKLLDIKIKDPSFYQNIVDENKFYKKHDDMWSAAPYPPTFITSDAFVYQGGHVLLIRRGRTPGLNCLALPGGYVDDERLLDCAIRELYEETRIKIPEPILRGSLFAQKVFDHPKRSLRGRIVTHAFGFHLENLDNYNELQELRGSVEENEVSESIWMPLHQLDTPEIRSQLFEDHWDIIQYFIDNMKKEWS